MGSLFQELKRRKVFRVAVAYAVVGWVLAQVAAFAVETFAAPQWVQQIFVVFLVLGFPLAIILAWAYEISPQGVESDALARRSKEIRSTTAQPINYIILSIVLLVAGFQVADRFVFGAGGGSTSTIATVEVSETGLRDDSSARTKRTAINLGMAGLNPLRLRTSIALSPDGTQLAYTVPTKESIQLYIRALDQLESRLIAETPIDIYGAYRGAYPFFSPDGEWLAFYGEDEILKIPVQGGTPQSVVEEEGFASLSPFGGFWSEEQTILYTTKLGSELHFLPATGDTSDHAVLTPINGEEFYWPTKLPQTDTVLINAGTRSNSIASGSIKLIDLETGEFRTLIDEGYNARYAPSGHIVFMRSGTLWAVPFDLGRLELTGNQVPVVAGVQTHLNSGVTVYAFSDEGELVYLPETATVSTRRKSALVWVSRDGSEELLNLEEQYYGSVNISPDGEKIAFTIFDTDLNSSRLWAYDIEREIQNVIAAEGNPNYPIWTPNGEQLIYGTSRAGLWSIAADGSGRPLRLTDPQNSYNWPMTWAADGQLIFDEQLSMHTLSLESGQTRPLYDPTDQVGAARISPDGRWIAYHSDKSGNWETYVRPYPNMIDTEWRISTEGGGVPRWRADMKELFYKREANGEIVSLSIETEPEFRAGRPEVVVAGDYNFQGWHAYDVHPDGQRLLMRKFVEDRDSGPVFTSLVHVDNWFEELKRLAPPDPQ